MDTHFTINSRWKRSPASPSFRIGQGFPFRTHGYSGIFSPLGLNEIHDIGPYNPDFGVVLRRKRLRDAKEAEFYFVVETKGTNELADKKALRESEVYKIKCALKHFDALGVDAHVNYDAPVKEYSVFKTRAKRVMHA